MLVPTPGLGVSTRRVATESLQGQHSEQTAKPDFENPAPDSPSIRRWSPSRVYPEAAMPNKGSLCSPRKGQVFNDMGCIPGLFILGPGFFSWR